MNEQKSTPETTFAPEPLSTAPDVDSTHSHSSVVERTPNPDLSTDVPVEASLVEAREAGEVIKLVGMPLELGFTAIRAVGEQLNRERVSDVENEDTLLAEEQLKLAFTTTNEKRTDFIPVDAGNIALDALRTVKRQQMGTAEGRAAEVALEAFEEVVSSSKLAA